MINRGSCRLPGQAPWCTSRDECPTLPTDQPAPVAHLLRDNGRALIFLPGFDGRNWRPDCDARGTAETAYMTTDRCRWSRSAGSCADRVVLGPKLTN